MYFMYLTVCVYSYYVKKKNLPNSFKSWPTVHWFKKTDRHLSSSHIAAELADSSFHVHTKLVLQSEL